MTLTGGHYLLEAEPEERVPPDATAQGGPGENIILGSEQNFMGMASRPLRAKECATIFSAQDGRGREGSPILSVLHR